MISPNCMHVEHLSVYGIQIAQNSGARGDVHFCVAG